MSINECSVHVILLLAQIHFLCMKLPESPDLPQELFPQEEDDDYTTDSIYPRNLDLMVYICEICFVLYNFRHC